MYGQKQHKPKIFKENIMAEEKAVKIPKFTTDPQIVQIAQSTDQVGVTLLSCLKSDGTIHTARLSGNLSKVTWIELTLP
jgi:hypothetical protein